MPKFKTDLLDQYCYEMFGHTNWGYLQCYDKDFIQQEMDLNKAVGVVFFNSNIPTGILDKSKSVQKLKDIVKNKDTENDKDLLRISIIEKRAINKYLDNIPFKNVIDCLHDDLQKEYYELRRNTNQIRKEM